MRWASAILIAALGTTGASAVTLTTDLPSPQPAGTNILVSVSESGDSEHLYQLSIAPADQPKDRRVIYAYQSSSTLEWSSVRPGSYVLIGSVLDVESGQQSAAVLPFTVLPAIPYGLNAPVVHPTRNPLVALYVAPPCGDPIRMRVRFFAPSIGVEQVTTPEWCLPQAPPHFLIAGMRQDTTYLMQHEALASDGTRLQSSWPISFTTGTAEIAISPSTIHAPAGPETSPPEPLIWNSTMIGNDALGLSPYPLATDLEGNLLWYWQRPVWALRPGADGSFWHITPDPMTGTANQLLTKADLLGNVIKQTSVRDLNVQLERRDDTDRINDIHHDVRELRNGDVAFIASVERLVTDLQGAGEVSVLGDMIIVTDKNLTIKWLWNAWDHLDPTRLATMGEVCGPGDAGCPPFYLGDESNDWTHANALALTPDGNLLLSVRNQDWVVKIDYDEGSGDGSILWRLGPDGDFTMLGGSEDDWFSHIHDPSYIADDAIVLFDNSNLRCEAEEPPPDCQSRGQIWQIDETAMTAELVFNKDLGDYAFAVGSAQQLANGNLWLNAGMLGTFAEPRATVQEVDPSGITVLQTDLDIFQYRSYRLQNLYSEATNGD
ncbi:aryl-sulfate sulfotransferase [Thiorhodococcus minor]|uniref:Arylsulfotransferase N-terminal domain-containing protein n=1 Tax=Thiorhodococcus minor TaxID=57489 RepID=A0A6M0K583_9GAMM|nr:aryl-sulfate sulfotransferase [Thiorhodococcus minor]NEV64451.1 hypothetical protein [Thiorhodococcus minor]